MALAQGLLWLLLNANLPLPLPVTVNASLSAPVLFFAVSVSLVAGVLFGLAPALQATRADVISTIKNENTGGGAPRRINLRSSLVAAQVAVSLVLLITAGLLLRSLQARQIIDPGLTKMRKSGHSVRSRALSFTHHSASGTRTSSHCWLVPAATGWMRLAAALDSTVSVGSPDSEQVTASERLKVRKSVSGSGRSCLKGRTMSRRGRRLVPPAASTESLPCGAGIYCP